MYVYTIPFGLVYIIFQSSATPIFIVYIIIITICCAGLFHTVFDGGLNFN